MYANPHTHLALARARHEDMIRDAQKHELARLATSDRPGLLTRLRSLVGSRGSVEQGVKHPVANPA
jgi:hypothetical protein